MQRQLTDSRQIRDLIDQGDATIGLEIDAGFAQKLRKGQTAPLQVIVDATNSNTALIASGYVTQIALGFAQDVPEGPHLPHRAAADRADALGRARASAPGTTRT